MSNKKNILQIKIASIVWSDILSQIDIVQSELTTRILTDENENNCEHFSRNDKEYHDQNEESFNFKPDVLFALLAKH
jgi:hypothetical protein